jgi:hypothetical protein
MREWDQSTLPWLAAIRSRLPWLATIAAGMGLGFGCSGLMVVFGLPGLWLSFIGIGFGALSMMLSLLWWRRFRVWLHV